MRSAAICLGLFLIFAGCAGPSEPAPAAAAPGLQPRGPSEVDVGSGSGAIQGLVTDNELVPLAGAYVQVIDSESKQPVVPSLNADEGGSFEVKNLQPGFYLVYASRLGYADAAPQRVQVLDEETTVVKFVLEPLAVLESHLIVFNYVWQPRFADAERIGSGGQGHGCVACSGKDEANYETDEATNGQLDAIVVESRWTSNNAFCNPQMQTNVFSPDEPRADLSAQRSTNPYYWNNEPNVTNPTRLVILREGSGMGAILSEERTKLNKETPLTVDGNWRFNTHLYATPIVPGVVGYSCAYELRVETWVTAFYLGLPEPDYTVFPDG